MQVAFERLLRLARERSLPEVEAGQLHGAPCLRVRGKPIASIKAEDTAVHFCSHEQKAFLLEADPAIYWETEHFRGWPALLVRLDVITDDELAHRLAEAWRHRVPKRLAAAYDASRQTGA